MATKRINEVIIKIRVPVPVVYPLQAGATAHYTVDGLKEVETRSVSVDGSVPGTGTTIGAILSAVKAGLEAAAQSEGDGGHTVIDNS